MECSFETRKSELQQECRVEPDLFSKGLARLSEFMKPYTALFVRQQQRDHAEKVVSGLCSDLKRKNAESIAYHFGMDRKPIQYFIGESEWDDSAVRKELASAANRS